MDALTKCGEKLKAPEVKQKSLELEGKEGGFFQAHRKRGQKDYPSLRWRDKNRAADSNLGEKTASWSRSLSSLDFVYRKLRQTP